MDVTNVISSPVTWAVVATTSLYVLYCYGTSTFDYFKLQGIPGPKPFPYFGNLWGAWSMNVIKHDRELVKKYGKTFGCFDGIQPNLFTVDIDLIKAVFVKDFDHFVNRRLFEGKSKFIRKMVSLMKDGEWKDVRSSLTPVFTTGKIKRMSPLIKECVERLTGKFEAIAREEGKVDAKKHFSAFSLDVIARCAFGMNLNRLVEENDPFFKNAMKTFNPPAKNTPLIVLPFISPMFMKLFGERLFASGFHYFIGILEELVAKRAESSEKHHDFIEAANEAISELTVDENGIKKLRWTKEEVDEIVIAQSTIFLLAGFDTTGATLTNAIYLLAKHPEVQNKLHRKIQERLQSYEEITHEIILNFPYLDHVINETMRMYPVAVREVGAKI